MGLVPSAQRRAAGEGEVRGGHLNPTVAAEGAAPIITIPALPEGRDFELPGRGTTFYREVAGPPGAPTVVLLHGWTATADLNWFMCYEGLGRHFRVIAPDHRGHGRGIRSRRSFRLHDCADDAAALCEALGIERYVAVGYSMGGIVAQLLWRRHREAVTGLVLAATAAAFVTTREARLSFLGLTSLGAMARATPGFARAWLTEQLYLGRKRATWDPWAVEEASLHDWRMVLEAGGDIGRFSSRAWLAEVDVPTSVIVTLRDHIVPVRLQLELIDGIRSVNGFRIDADHDACVAAADRFLPLLVTAIHATSPAF